MVVRASSTSSLSWIGDRTVPLDFGGPTEIPFEKLADSARETPILQLFEDAVRRHADRVAVYDGKTRLTYAETLDRVYGLLAELEGKTREGAVVAAIIHNTAAVPIVMMACLASGRFFIPIDAGYPLERQSMLYKESRVEAIVVEVGVAIDDSFVPVDATRIEIDPLRHTGAAPSRRIVDMTAPAGAVFTSGSTGRPKGVAYSLDTFVGTTIDHINAKHINKNDVLIGIASLSAIGAQQVLAALLTGALLRIVDLQSVGLSGGMRILGDEGITVLTFVPSVLRMIMQVEGIEHALRHLRILDLTGERLMASDVALFRSKLPRDCHIHLLMGSMEAASVFGWFVRDDQIMGPVVPVGYLAPGKSVALIKEEDGTPAGAGEPGELMVRGRNVALGAWKDGRIEAGPFVQDQSDPKARIFPIGDIVRLREDGLAEYLGRRDRQVKLRGLRVDLGEVEAALRNYPGIADAVAIAEERPSENDRLTAFVTLSNGAQRPAFAALRDAVVAETAEHMAPARVHVLSEIPRLPNHKPDLVRLADVAREMARERFSNA